MRKNMPKFERFLAVVLVLAMILSFVPAGAFAEDAAQSNVTTLAAKLVREKVEVAAEPENPTEPTVAPSEPGGDSVEPMGTPPTAPVSSVEVEQNSTATYVYNYTLNILVNGEAQKLAKENVSWFYDDGKPIEMETEKAGVLEAMEEDNVYAVAVYDGVSIPVKLDGGDEKVVTVAPLEQAWSETIPVGGLIVLESGLNAEGIQGLTHERVVSSNLKEHENGYYAPAAGTVTIDDIWKSASGAIYAKKVYQAEAVEMIPAAVFTVGSGTAATGWYSEAQTVRIAVVNSLKLVSADYLPAVTVGEGTYSNWVEKDGSFVQEVLLSESATVFYGKGTAAEASLEVNIDAMRPVATILYSWTNKKTNTLQGKYRITTGPSGLAKVTINNTEIDISNVKRKVQNDGTIVYEGSFSDIPIQNETKIVAESNAGLSSDVTAKAPLSVKFTYVSDDKLVGSTIIDGKTKYFLKDDKQVVEIDVMNCDAGLQLSLSAQDQDGKDIENVKLESSDNGKTYKGTVSLANGLSALKVIVNDSDAPEGQQNTEHELDVLYTLDRTAPVVKVKRDKVPASTKNGIEYFAEAVSYIFSIEDDLFDYKDFTVEYQFQGEKDSRTAYYDKVNRGIVVKVENGQHLISMTVHGADRSGNEVKAVLVDGENAFTWGEGTTYKCSVKVDTDAPEITAEISDNVKLFYINGDKSFAVLDQTKDCSIVTLTITAKDANLDTESLSANGWSMNPDDNSFSTTFSVEVPKDGTGKLDFNFHVADNSGLISSNVIVVDAHGEKKDAYATAMVIAPAVGANNSMSGTYQGTILIDRRPPSSISEGTPNIDLTLAEGAVSGYTGGEKPLELFKDAFTYEMHITDRSGSEQKPGFDAGLMSVSWELNPEVEGLVEVNAPVSANAEDHEITITPVGKVEAKVCLTIYAEDFAGNIFTYVKNFVVDNMAPRVDVKYQNKNDQNMNDPAEEPVGYVVNGEKYYNHDIVACVTIEDMNANMEADTIMDGVKKAVVSQADGKYKVEFTDENTHDVKIYAKDMAGNGASGNDAPLWSDEFVIDKTAPEIIIELLDLEGAPKAELKVLEDADYYNAPFQVRIAICDRNLNYDPNSTLSAAEVSYTTENGGVQTTKLADNWEPKSVGGKLVYDVVLILNDGDVLTDISITARDNANNNAQQVNVDSRFNAEKMTFEAAGSEEAPTTFTSSRKVVVDMTRPQVSVTKVVEDNSYIQTFGGNAYYNKPVSYQFMVTDKFMDLTENAGRITIEAVYDNGETEILELSPVEEGEQPDEDGEMPTEETEKKLSDEESYTYEMKVEDGKTLKNIKILAVDNVGWNAAQPVVHLADLEGIEVKESSAVTKTATDDQGNEIQVPISELITSFAEKNGVWSCTAEPIIVDTVKPEVNVKFSENVQSFYTNGNTIYVILSSPVVSQGSNAAEERVTVTVTTKDKNLTLKENVYALRSGNETDGWKGNTAVNADSEMTLSGSTEKVAVNEMDAFVFDAKIIDLAGNAPDEVVFSVGNNEHVAATDPATGYFNRTISLDRRTPTSSNDTEAPVIEITPSMTPVKTADGKDLFSGSFNYSLKVTDGKDNSLNAGIQTVKWTVTDANGVVKTDEGVVSFGERTMEMTDSIPVTINGNGESNDVVIYIEAVDNVGNTITYTTTIGADNLAPRVTIEYSNHNVKNEFYFNANQDITVTVEDLNFNASTSTVNTQVDVPGWSAIGDNKYRITLGYHSDGDYTFDMATTDLAGNVASIDIPAVLQKFTIDKTAPVINVVFDPAVPIGTDAAGVQYFDKNRTVTVTINEHNFRASDVRADLGASNALSSFSDRNDIHVASEIFTEGNNYRVTVSYEDLAGNAAQTYTSPYFSIDLTAPTITMTGGNLEMGKLNIVPDDLTLAFTIQDDQNNLKNFGAEVIFLDRNYREHKVEGAEFYTISGQGSRTTGYVNFTNIARTKENDGIYTIRLYAEDFSGHVVDLSPALIVSLNRFGSSFMVKDPYTEEFLMPDETGVVYHDNVSSNLVFKEINPTQVWQDADHTARGSVITIAVNGTTLTLEEGVHYELTVEQKGNTASKWYEYTYSIYPEVFLENGELVDGEYSIFFYSEDEAGNRNSNETNVDAVLQMDANKTYSGKVSFVLDHRLPVVTILGVEDGESSFDTNRRVEINISDNTPTIIEIYINDEIVERVELADGMEVNSDWFYYDEETGSYYLNISGKKIPQNLKVVVTDAAGNRIEHEVNRLMLTDDVFAQYINSVPAILGSVVLLLALVFLFIVMSKRRKKETEQTAAKA